MTLTQRRQTAATESKSGGSTAMYRRGFGGWISVVAWAATGRKKLGVINVVVDVKFTKCMR